MRAQLKTMASPDTGDLPGYLPEDPHAFALLIRAGIGVEGLEEFEVFEFLLCTPPWLAQQMRPGEVRPLNHLLLTTHYDFARLLEYVQKFCARCEGEDWFSIARQLQALGRWEFEKTA